MGDLIVNSLKGNPRLKIRTEGPALNGGSNTKMPMEVPILNNLMGDPRVNTLKGYPTVNTLMG